MIKKNYKQGYGWNDWFVTFLTCYKKNLTCYVKETEKRDSVKEVLLNDVRDHWTSVKSYFFEKNRQHKKTQQKRTFGWNKVNNKWLCIVSVWVS